MTGNTVVCGLGGSLCVNLGGGTERVVVGVSGGVCCDIGLVVTSGVGGAAAG